jgi:hypothetical protein
MGDERWFNNNNKSGKSPHAIQREAYQQELGCINKALEQLVTLEDTSAMEETILSLKERTTSQYNLTMYSSMVHGFPNQQDGDQFHSPEPFFYGVYDYTTNRSIPNSDNNVSIDRSRYNSLRPSVSAASYRLQGYPDATDYGWLYAGCDETSCVEFFEKQFVQEEMDANRIPGSIALPTVKLDWFYTTGDCTLVMHHPINGLNYLFTSRDGISPELYVQILETPRVHHLLRAMHQNERQIVSQLPVQNGSNSNRSDKKKKDSRKETETKSNIAVGQNGWK